MIGQKKPQGFWPRGRFESVSIYAGRAGLSLFGGRSFFLAIEGYAYLHRKISGLDVEAEIRLFCGK